MQNPFRRRQPVIEEKSLADPDATLLEIFGLSLPGATTVSASTAMTVTPVAAAVRTISEAAATLDVRVKHRDADGTETVDNTHPAAMLLRGEANGWTSGFELVRDLVAQALTNDAGGLAWVNRVGGKPAEIIRYDAGIISVIYDGSGSGEPSYRLNSFPTDSADIVHVRGPFSRCPLTLARKAISVAYVLESHADKLFTNGARPGGVIEATGKLGDDGLKRMLAAWRSAHSGADNTGKTAVLWDGAKFNPLAFKSTDAQFLELRQFQIAEIARAFNLPQHMIGKLDRATWGNTESLGREFLSYCLEPWLRALEAAFHRALFTPEERPLWRIEFDRDDLTRADLATRATAINSLVASRVLNPNEGRSWLDLPPYAEGDTFANPNTGSSQPNTPPGGNPNAA